jgi:hypothetical protein
MDVRAHRRALLAVALVCAVACAGLWRESGILNTRSGGDSPFLLIRVHQLVQALGDGVFPVRWMADGAFGLGYPFFNFYASLPFYLAAVIAMFGLPLTFAIKLTQTLGMFGAGFALYGFALRRMPPAAAAFAAITYVLAPFHLANIYIRGDSLSEFWAFVWFPLILWCIDALTEAALPARAIVLRMLALAATLAALVLTHNVSALLFAPFIVIWAMLGLLRGWRGERGTRTVLRRTALLAAAALLALGLSAWFWLPALGEAAQAQLGDQTSGYFNFRNHFRWPGVCGIAVFESPCPDLPIDQTPLVQSTVAPGSEPLPSFALGLVQACVQLLALIVVLLARRRGRAYWAIAALCAMATVLITPLSAPVWSALPPLQLAQFPWRMLSVQALFGALLAGGAYALLRGARAPVSQPASDVVVPRTPRLGIDTTVQTVLIFVALFSTPPVTHLAVNNDQINARSSQLFEWYSGIIGTTIRGEYLPNSAVPAPGVGPELLGQQRRALLVRNSGNTGPGPRITSVPLVLESHSQTWRITVKNAPATVTLPLIYTPAWRAASDRGETIALQAYVGSGWTELTLPPGDHNITLSYIGTTLQQTAETVSGLTAVLAAVLCILALARTPRREIMRVAGRIALVCLVSLAALLAYRLSNRKAPEPTAAEWVDFDRTPFPNQSAVRFFSTASLPAPADTRVLLGATIEPRILRAGGIFTLTLRWDGEPIPLELVHELPSARPTLELFQHARTRTPVNTIVTTHTMPLNTLPGQQLLSIVPAGGWSANEKAAYVAGKYAPGYTLIGPIVGGTPPNAPQARLLALTNGLRLHNIDWLMPTRNRVCFRAVWSAGTSRNEADALQVSYKLRAADGRLAAQADGQPQQGLAPTWSWQTDVLVNDSRCVDIDPKTMLAQGEAYTLETTWYRARDFAVTGQGAIGGVADIRDGALNEPREAR